MTDYKTSTNSDSAEHSSDIDNSTVSFHQEEEFEFNYADYRLEDWLAFGLFWLLAITVFSQFVSRFVFSAPLGWTEEVARYQLVGLGFIGACIGIRKNTHIFVALFHRWLPKTVSIKLYQFIALFNVVFIATLAYFAWLIIPKLQIHKMASIDLSVNVLYGFLFASLLIMLFRSVQFLIKVIQQPNLLTEQQ